MRLDRAATHASGPQVCLQMGSVHSISMALGYGVATHVTCSSTCPIKSLCAHLIEYIQAPLCLQKYRCASPWPLAAAWVAAAITSQQSHGSKTESSAFSTEHSSSCKAPHDRCKTQQQERRSRLNVSAACRCMGSGATVSPRKLASSLENPEWQPLHSTVDKMHEILPCKQPGTSHRSAMWPSRQAESGGGEVN